MTTTSVTALEEIQAREAKHVLQTYRRNPLNLVRGQGVRLFDSEGREYYDLLSGIGVASLGHAHPGIARAIADWALAQSENSAHRFYSMSAQIRQERNAYYDILEKTQKATLEITPWMEWFLGCLGRAFDGTETTLSSVLRKARFWDTHNRTTMNDRQRVMLNKMLDGFDGKLNSSKWAKIANCSQDTAQRDIQYLINQGILAKDSAGGRSTCYSLRD